MTPTVEYIQARFDEYNTTYFNGQLPPLATDDDAAIPYPRHRLDRVRR